MSEKIPTITVYEDASAFNCPVCQEVISAQNPLKTKAELADPHELDRSHFREHRECLSKLDLGPHCPHCRQRINVIIQPNETH